jgi:hypothetical protein
MWHSLKDGALRRFSRLQAITTINDSAQNIGEVQRREALQALKGSRYMPQ